MFITPKDWWKAVCKSALRLACCVVCTENYFLCSLMHTIPAAQRVPPLGVSTGGVFDYLARVFRSAYVGYYLRKIECAVTQMYMMNSMPMHREVEPTMTSVCIDQGTYVPQCSCKQYDSQRGRTECASPPDPWRSYSLTPPCNVQCARR